MAGLPKKYAKMGFKKGWAAFKRVKARLKNNRKGARATTIRSKPRVRQVARRKAKKTYRRSSKGTDPKTVILPAMAYGGVREKISNMLRPVTSKIPLGDVADEVAMGALTYYGAKKGKGMVKKIALAGFTIECARLGEAVSQGSLGTFMGGNSTSGNGVQVI